MSPEDDELAGWKQIASYLGVSQPTAKKYWKEKRLPVIDRGKRYFAFKSQLDLWRRPSQPTAKKYWKEERLPVINRGKRYFAPKPRLWSLVLVLPAIAVLIWASLERPGRIVEARTDGSEVVAVGEDDEELWRVELPDLTAQYRPILPMVVDVDLDGHNDVLVDVAQRLPEEDNGRLVCLDHRGRIRWDFSYGRELTLHGRYFEPTFRGHHLRWLETWAGAFILLVARHSIWFPTQISLLEPVTGQVVSEYLHPGYVQAIEIVDLDRDGREELLLGGTNNPGPGFGFASLVVLDLPFAPPRAGVENYFGPPNARERAYMLFARPDLFAAQGLLSVLAIHVQDSNRLLVSFGTPEIALHFYLDAEFRPIEVRPTDPAVVEHNRLWQVGLLDHRYDPEEHAGWGTVLQFPTAPDGNSPQVRRAFSQAIGQAGQAQKNENN